MKGNFDGSCKTSYNVLSHSHRDWIELCLSEVRVGGRGLVVDIRGGDAEERGCLPFYLPQISGHSGRDVNVKCFFGSSHWKIPWTNGNSEKVVPFSRLGRYEWKFIYHLQVS